MEIQEENPSPSPTYHSAQSSPLRRFSKQEMNEISSKLLLRQGDHCYVYKCILNARMNVIVKETKSAADFEKFENEIRCFELCNHPNIIKLIGTRMTLMKGFIVTELTWCTLEEAIGNPETREAIGNPETRLGEIGMQISLDWRGVLKVIMGVTNAIQYLHSKQIKVGHLKLSDILLDENCNPKLCDFGSLRPNVDNEDISSSDLKPHDVGDDIHTFGMIILQVITKSMTDEKILLRKVGKEYLNQNYIVHESLRESGCTNEDAKIIMELGLRMTIGRGKRKVAAKLGSIFMTEGGIRLEDVAVELKRLAPFSTLDDMFAMLRTFNGIDERKCKYLDEGKFSRVYLTSVVIQNVQRQVVVKASKDADATCLDQFQNEVKLLSSFEHANIIKMFEYRETNDSFYIAMEFAAKGDLYYNIEELDWNQTLKIIMGIAHGLQYLQLKKVRIGDLKSKNILLDQNYNPKLCDFGTAETESDEGYKYAAIGTLGFMDHLAYTEPGLHNDVFSFGVVILQLITKSNEVIFPELGEHLFDSVVRKYTKGKDPVNQKLRASGCSLEDANRVTELGIVMTSRNTSKNTEAVRKLGDKYRNENDQVLIPIEDVLAELEKLKVGRSSVGRSSVETVNCGC